MKSIKIIDHRAGDGRRRALYECLGLCQIYANKVQEGRGVLFALIKAEQLERLLNEESKEKLKQYGFEAVTPIEYEAMRSVVARELDGEIKNYSKDEIIEHLERQNSWAKIDNVYVFDTSSNMMKIKFKSSSMAIKADKDGMIIVNQDIPASKIEKELFIRLDPCRNCLNYDHDTRSCTEEKRELCVRCGEEGHKINNCKADKPKCKSCDGEHNALAAKCPVRKSLIKDKRRDIRAKTRSRSRSQAKQTWQQEGETKTSSKTGSRSYAQVTGVGAGESEIKMGKIPDTSRMTTVILTAIIYAHYVETMTPGSFQETVDGIFEDNGLPKVKLPEKRPDIDINIKKLAQQMSPGSDDEEEEPPTPFNSYISPNEDNGEEGNAAMETENMGTKRGRQESPTEVTSQTKKTKEAERDKENKKQREEAERRKTEEMMKQKEEKKKAQQSGEIKLVPLERREIKPDHGVRPRQTQLSQQQQRQKQQQQQQMQRKQTITASTEKPVINVILKKTNYTQGLQNKSSWTEQDKEKFQEYAEREILIMEYNGNYWLGDEVIRTITGKDLWNYLVIKALDTAQYSKESMHAKRMLREQQRRASLSNLQ